MLSQLLLIEWLTGTCHVHPLSPMQLGNRKLPVLSTRLVVFIRCVRLFDGARQHDRERGQRSAMRADTPAVDLKSTTDPTAAARRGAKRACGREGGMEWDELRRSEPHAAQPSVAMHPRVVRRAWGHGLTSSAALPHRWPSLLREHPLRRLQARQQQTQLAHRTAHSLYTHATYEHHRSAVRPLSIERRVSSPR